MCLAQEDFRPSLVGQPIAEDPCKVVECKGGRVSNLLEILKAVRNEGWCVNEFQSFRFIIVAVLSCAIVNERSICFVIFFYNSTQSSQF